MAKGYNTNQERLAEISRLGKDLAKRAGFRCEWCESKDELRPWDHDPDREPELSGLALLCDRCRQLADGATADPNELHTLRNALWSDIPAVAEGVALVLIRSRQPWVREAIEESLIEEAKKSRLLALL
ncbi:hypothetical protein SAMN02745119_02071 [Trichlorobacter thiogenes]|uniref:Phosphonoacetate hydrolase n=1 Tax=Trichlorobacter thiogenes TaxID=115783 RepID=A0A1T4PPN0_9BACT|nr:hypothetical protein [Trichlorobacter thiogenes]SJZ93512.1 hypothetical protein SAMN02745119_02071 [Trichlorobacter thiogenes]